VIGNLLIDGDPSGPARREPAAADEVAREQLGGGQALTGALLMSITGTTVGPHRREHVDAADDQQIVLVTGERRENGRELEVGLRFHIGRPKILGDRAIGRIHDDESLGELRTSGARSRATHDVE
jgi:hypothetical protein